MVELSIERARKAYEVKKRLTDPFQTSFDACLSKYNELKKQYETMGNEKENHSVIETGCQELEEKIKKFEANDKVKEFSEYRSRLGSCGPMIQQTGLANTLAFYYSKQGIPWTLGCDILKWLKDPKSVSTYPYFQDCLTIQAVLYLKPYERRVATSEALLFVENLKRFVEGNYKQIEEEFKKIKEWITQTKKKLNKKPLEQPDV